MRLCDRSQDRKFTWSRYDFSWTGLGKYVKRDVLIVDETPGDEVQLPPVVSLTARHHELPVRNLSATEIQNQLHFLVLRVLRVTWGRDSV